MKRRTKRRSPTPAIVLVGWISAFLFPLIGLAIAIYLGMMARRRDIGIAIGAVSIIMIGIWDFLLDLF